MRLFRHHSTCLRVSLEALTRHGMRTSLSILGVVLGVAAVIAVMSVSEGARREILRQVELLGLDNVVVHRRGLPGADRVFQVESSGLTLGDVDRLRRQIPLVEAVSPVAVRYEQISGPVRTRPAVLLGTNAGYRDILSLDMGRGRFIVPCDDETAARVTVLGASLTQSRLDIATPWASSFAWAQRRSVSWACWRSARRARTRSEASRPGISITPWSFRSAPSPAERPVSIDGK